MITLVKNEHLHFISFDKISGWKELSHTGLDPFIKGEMEPDIFSGQIRDKTNHLLVVSDFWMGNGVYEFQSKKKAFAESFIERKLLTGYSETPQIKYFYDFLFQTHPDRGQSLYVYFLQESRFFELYDRLGVLGLAPRHVTTPAFLWENQLKKNIADFSDGDKGFIHLLSKECFLYFFHKGRYLFSRSIIIPEDQVERDQILELLSYEIGQSEYLFSQKARSEIDQLYLLSAHKITSRDLSETLGRDIKDFEIEGRDASKEPGIIDDLGPVTLFNPEDLKVPEPKGFLNISHRQLKQELWWRPVQGLGMAVGLAVIFLLLIEAFFLWGRHQPNLSLVDQLEKPPMERSVIQKYNQALDLILSDSAHLRPERVMRNIAMSVPRNVRIQELHIDSESNPGVEISGIVTASGPYNFKETLSAFLSRLNQNMQGSRMVNIQDVDFNIAENNADKTYQDYLIRLRIDLP